jgi:hypothetical protein
MYRLVRRSSVRLLLVPLTHRLPPVTSVEDLPELDRNDSAEDELTESVDPPYHRFSNLFIIYK